jgi:hypothetical protein
VKQTRALKAKSQIISRVIFTGTDALKSRSRLIANVPTAYTDMAYNLACKTDFTQLQKEVWCGSVCISKESLYNLNYIIGIGYSSAYKNILFIQNIAKMTWLMTDAWGMLSHCTCVIHVFWPILFYTISICVVMSYMLPRPEPWEPAGEITVK